MEEQNKIEKPMTVEEASEFLGIAVGTLKNKCYNGEVPFHKPAGKMYFYASELTEYIKGDKNG